MEGEQICVAVIYRASKVRSIEIANDEAWRQEVRVPTTRSSIKLHDPSMQPSLLTFHRPCLRARLGAAPLRLLPTGPGRAVGRDLSWAVLGTAAGPAWLLCGPRQPSDRVGLSPGARDHRCGARARAGSEALVSGAHGPAGSVQISRARSGSHTPWYGSVTQAARCRLGQAFLQGAGGRIRLGERHARNSEPPACLQLRAPPRRLHAALHLAWMGLVAVARGAAAPAAPHADATHPGKGLSPWLCLLLKRCLHTAAHCLWRCWQCHRAEELSKEGIPHLPCRACPSAVAVSAKPRPSTPAPPGCQRLQSRLCVQAQLQGLLLGTAAASLLQLHGT